ncbi:MAG: XTP/dITP diphosphatase [Deltaproteobacteria bacterium]|nr:XTP/dITP diphosphatase [Candidatus Zymogenaceae bacterium]
MEVVLATKNRGKVRDFADIFDQMGLSDRITLLDLSHFPGFPDVPEDGATFSENALIKARAAAAHTGKISVADDSGIVVDALGGAPGIYSARFAGVSADDRANNEKLLQMMKDVPEAERRASFRAAVAIVSPEGKEEVVVGECHGYVAAAPLGTNGFGYDPLFFYLPLNKTYGQMTDEQKNRISHRRRAIEACAARLVTFIDNT